MPNTHVRLKFAASLQHTSEKKQRARAMKTAGGKDKEMRKQGNILNTRTLVQVGNMSETLSFSEGH